MNLQQAERLAAELQGQLESLNTELEHAGGLNEKYLEVQRRREQEITKLRKDLEQAGLAVEDAELQMRKKQQSVLIDLQSEVDQLQKAKVK